MKGDEKIEDFSKMIGVVNSNKNINTKDDYYEACKYFLNNNIITQAGSSNIGNRFIFTETGKELIKYHQQMQE